METKSNFKTEDNVFDPPQVAALAMRKADETVAHNDTDKLYTGLPSDFDSYFVMWRRQRVVGILGDTSNYKTGLMTFIARESAKQLKADDGEIGIYATWEDPVEDYALADIANASRISLTSIYDGSVTKDQRNMLLKHSMSRAAFPLWLFGHSEYQNSRRPRLTMSDINLAMEYIVDVQKKTVKFICLDYLQRISYADLQVKDARLGFVEIVNRVKDMAMQFNCGVMLGSQVQREIRERKEKQPQVHDAQETSNFEQTCDGIISVQMPIKTMRRGDLFAKSDGGNRDIGVTNRLLSVEVLKQKKGATGKRFIYDAMYETNGVEKYSGDN
jgi:replicative DNA helicase